MYPTFRYHPTKAPHGRRFTDEAEFNALSEEWVDTPAKFPPPTSAEIEARFDQLLPPETRRRGRPRKAEAVQ